MHIRLQVQSTESNYTSPNHLMSLTFIVFIQFADCAEAGLL